MIRVQSSGLTCYHFGALESGAIMQGVFTRLGGASQAPYASLNVGHTVGDVHERVEANLQAIYGSLGVSADRVVTARQVHGNRVAWVDATDGGRVCDATDALISATPGLLLLLRFADCVPVFFWDPVQQVVGLAHAGWQGTLKRVAAATAQALMATFGCRPADLHVGIGPSIGPCCFRVGPEVVAQVRQAFAAADSLLQHSEPDGAAHLDLWEANSRQLRDLGIERIEVAELCTCCRCDEFYSHRAEAGLTGRFAAVLGLAAEA